MMKNKTRKSIKPEEIDMEKTTEPMRKSMNNLNEFMEENMEETITLQETEMKEQNEIKEPKIGGIMEIEIPDEIMDRVYKTMDEYKLIEVEIKKRKMEERTNQMEENMGESIKLMEENKHKKDDTQQEDTTNENEDNLLIGAAFVLKPDEYCMCCGRSRDEIQPFVIGNPLIEKYNGALLLKTYRNFRRWYVEELEKALQEAKKIGIESEHGFEKWLIDKYGKEKGENLMSIYIDVTEIDKFWVCKDCFILDDDEFNEVLDKRLSQEEKYLD